MRSEQAACWVENNEIFDKQYKAGELRELNSEEYLWHAKAVW